ncbi:MAG TPA: ATP-binding cassette domain-containing protein [Acidimicrobiales bacterium]|nr:ATP-binding cassette domain-containing protein [Acidimicrobiales bacterium]
MSDRATPPALALHGVVVVRGGAVVLQDVDWVVEPDQRWVVLGSNGSGKTTLLNLAAGYLHPAAGTVDILGRRLGRVDVRQLRERLGLTSAELSKKIRPDLAAIDVVMSGLHGALETWWHHYSPADRRRAAELMAAGGVGALADHPFATLSEGERQQVQLARALVARPELVLLDEPNAGLDLGAREALASRLGALAADAGCPPMVLVTHHVEEIPGGFTHLLLLRRGRVVAGGPLADTLTSENLSATFGLALEVVGHRGRWACHAV